MLNVNNRALRGSRLVRSTALVGSILHPARVTRMPGIEYKDGDAAKFGVEIKEAFGKFEQTFADFQKKNDERLKEIEKKGSVDFVTKDSLDKITSALDTLKKEVNDEIMKLKRPTAGPDNKLLDTEEKKAYSKDFERYWRTGYGETKGTADWSNLVALEKKALSVGSDPDGGYTARPEMENAIDQTLKQVSPVRDMASVRTIGANSYKKLVNVHGTASGWVGETESRPQTAASTLRELEFPMYTLYAMPAATSDILDDSYINIDAWMADEVSLEFAQKEGAAFAVGDGVKKPRGFTAYNNVANASYTWGNVGYIASGAAGAFGANPADKLIDLYHALKTQYRPGAQWACNNAVLAELRKIKDGMGNYIINLRLADDGVVERIMGKPVNEVPDMVDIAANSYSIAFADFKRAYLIIDRMGVRVLRDPFTSKPYTLFYTTKRVGGGIQNFEAIKLMKFAAS